MKKIAFNYICVICALLFVSCNNEEKEDNVKVIYPQDTSYHPIENLVGQLHFDESSSTWSIIAEHAYPTPFVVGDEMGVTLFIEDMDEAFKQYKDKTVMVRGKYKQLYTKIFDTKMGRRMDYYSIAVEKMEEYNTFILNEGFRY